MRSESAKGKELDVDSLSINSLIDKLITVDGRGSIEKYRALQELLWRVKEDKTSNTLIEAISKPVTYTGRFNK